MFFRSDVLGQFMPLVGKDWTQSGVARLFTAIKVHLLHPFFHNRVSEMAAFQLASLEFKHVVYSAKAIT